MKESNKQREHTAIKTNLFAAALVGVFAICCYATQIIAQESRYEKAGEC
jgi:hypothetical protein